MIEQTISLRRLFFLVLLVSVFLFTYLADFNIFSFVFSAVTFSSATALEYFTSLLLLSLIALSMYYLLFKPKDPPVPQRYVFWVKIFLLAFAVGMALSVAVLYFQIFFNYTFDL